VYLKQLEMRGFKSFADQTRLDFGPGITGIVGPNGVGKSNVSDAILWVLGEQSYRTLRTENSQDVIFSGTAARKALSMAEVSLTFDNSDGRLPTEFSEVNISRRLFRSGESQYLINKSVCRLRDVRDLLLGTGAGPGAYSVIGQGEIDTILSIRSEDRRELIEEVAGVRKYRIRRDDATRKLERTEANLTRISDIVYELASQRAPLEKQAEVARAYRELDERLRYLERQLLALDFQKLSDARGHAINESAIAQADLVATRSRLDQVETEYTRLKAQLDDRDSALQKLHIIAGQKRQQVADARQQRAVGRERLRSLDELIAATDEDTKGWAERVEALSGQVEALLRQHRELSDSLADAERTRDEQAARVRNAERSLQDRENAISALLEQRNEALRRVAALENEASALADLQTDLTERAGRLRAQEQTLSTRVGELDGGLSAAAAEQQQTAQALEGATARRGRADAATAAARALLREHRAKRELLAAAIGRLRERNDVLTELQQAYEGYPEGLRAVLAAAGDDALTGIEGVIGDMLNVEENLERAMHAALEDCLGWIITATRDDALAALEYLGSLDNARAVFFPLDTPVMSTGPGEAPTGEAGCLGSAAELVEFPERYRSVFEPLLGEVLVCEDLPCALRVHAAGAGRYRVVTRAGEVVEKSGAIRSGPGDVPGAQAFGRKRELESIQAQLAVLEDALSAAWQAEERLEAERDRSQAELQAAEDDLGELRTRKAQADKELAHLQSTRQAAQSALAENAADIERLEQQLEGARERHEAALAGCREQRTAAEQLAQEVARLRGSADPTEAVEHLRTELTERQVALAEIRERVASIEHTVDRLKSDLNRAQTEHARATQERKRLTQEQESLQTGLESEQGGAGEAEAELQKLDEEIKARVDEASELREQVAALDGSMRKLSHAATEQNERLHRAEIACTREEERLQAITERLADTYEMTPEQAAELVAEDLDENAARREARALRSHIRELGHVNLSAIDEYDRLSSREDYLRKQEEDLRQARDDLLRVIAEIDQAAEAAFMEVFGKVREAFSRTLQRLFDGGEGELKLTDEERPLQAGVDIFVQLPGKRPQNLMMLSGGERAKVAIALLFAMLEVNPSPFCLLDEIDAPLDDANTERFGDILQDFTRETQFIIITHNPHTMERVDKLHGITMAEPGASKVISVKLEEAQRQAQSQRNEVPAE
jgi:chromosome segregation protein